MEEDSEINSYPDYPNYNSNFEYLYAYQEKLCPFCSHVDDLNEMYKNFEI